MSAEGLVHSGASLGDGVCEEGAGLSPVVRGHRGEEGAGRG